MTALPIPEVSAPTPRTQRSAAASAPLTGTLLAVLSAAAFSTSGALAASLLATGWTPAAIVTFRLGLAALVLLGPALWQVRGRTHLLRRHWRRVVVYGLVTMAACQLAFFYAVSRLSVGVALLLEYTAPVLIVALVWARTRRRPSWLRLGGAATAMLGLALVLDVFSGFRIDPVGVVFGLAAAVCLVAYFMMSAHADDELPPLVLATGGLVSATVVLAVVGTLGLVPMAWSTDAVVLLGHRTSPLVPLLAISLVAAALAYLTGIAASRRLGATMASFLGLLEVFFAVVWAWLLLDQLPLPVQLLGGVVIMAGVVAVKVDEVRVGRTLPG
ncbi:EamA family transporter [Auraticoccus monumenti]|uniref:Threonine/homoserine efflux transporter RhtA n=1 Tax=Auraticoccus monumenti TaxID=675864 RepID=A0A1G6UT77_9ACTN|nr:EamA family transporter [Auraticoccus monumenti]SDD44454.1 Threonine/homoserine efflux transporter RhtA [Auraticoccus monumenti]